MKLLTVTTMLWLSRGESRGIADMMVERAKPDQEPTLNIAATPVMHVVPSIRTVSVRSKPMWKTT